MKDACRAVQGARLELRTLDVHQRCSTSGLWVRIPLSLYLTRINAYFFIMHCRVYFGGYPVGYGGVNIYLLCSSSRTSDYERLAHIFTTLTIIPISTKHDNTRGYTHRLVADKSRRSQNMLPGLYVSAFEIS